MLAVRVPGPNGPLLVRAFGRPDPHRPRPLYLLFSGWGPGVPALLNPMTLQARWLAADADVLTAYVPLTGMGSPGTVDGLTRADFLGQALAAHDQLAALPGVAGVNAVGESFGGYLALLLSARRPLDRLVLRVPTDVDPDGFDSRPQTELAGTKGLAWKSAAHGPGDSQALVAAARFGGECWLVSAGRDTIVPRQTTDNTLGALDPARTHHVHLPGAGHAMFGHIGAFRRLLCEAALTPVGVQRA